MKILSPRFYAMNIQKLATKEERRKALAAVPAHLQNLVEYMVRDAFLYAKKRQAASAVAKAKRKINHA